MKLVGGEVHQFGGEASPALPLGLMPDMAQSKINVLKRIV